MAMIHVDLVQGSPEWHKWRKTGIGGSDAPVIEGTSPYKTPRTLMLEKLGTISEDEDGNDFIFAKGHKTETMIRKQFRELAGVEMVPFCAQHSKFDYIKASLDGFDSKLGVLEAKLVGADVISLARKDGTIPKHHYTQIQHQLEVTGCDVAQWFGHDGKKAGVIVPVTYDKEFVKRLLDMEHGFWANLKAGTIPALTERDYLYPEDLKLLADLREMKELSENAALQFDELKKNLDSYGHNKVAGAGVKAFKVTKQGAVKWASIPEVAEAQAKIEKSMSEGLAEVERIKNNLKPEYVEKFRSAPSSYWSVIMDKKGSK
jgi:putative phage-type endonuclease